MATVWILYEGEESSRMLEPASLDVLDLAISEERALEMYNRNKVELRDAVEKTWTKSQIVMAISLEKYLNENELIEDKRRVYYCGIYRLILEKYEGIL